MAASAALALSFVTTSGLAYAFAATDTYDTPASMQEVGGLPLCVTVTGAWADDTRDVPAGSLFVPIAQPEARLVMSLLEPGDELVVFVPNYLQIWGWARAIGVSVKVRRCKRQQPAPANLRSCPAPVSGNPCR